jgi:predicted ribosome quality control (RQC) complex YloA/Tae2 family protein
MVNHYFTLKALCSELRNHLIGAVIHEIFTQQKDEVIILLDKHNVESGDSNPALQISIAPALNYIFYRDSISRAKKNSADLFTDTIGSVINSVSIHPSDRIIEISLNNGLFLCFQLYGSARSNIILADNNNVIRSAFKHEKELKNSVSNLREGFTAPSSFISLEGLKSKLLGDSSKTILTALKQSITFLGTLYSREVLSRLKIDENTLAFDLQDAQINSIHQEVSKILIEVEQPTLTIYYRGEEIIVLSPVNLKHLEGNRKEIISSVSDAIRLYVAKINRSRNINSDKEARVKKINNELVSLRKKSNSLQKQILESARAEEYEHIGKVLLSNLQSFTKGEKEVELTDFLNDNKLIRVVLNPKLGPVENATAYFEKAKKIKTTKSESERHLRETEIKIIRLERVLSKLDGCQTDEEVKEFFINNEQDLSEMQIVFNKKEEERVPFRVFSVIGGCEVWVGKNSASNDLLTMKYAKPHDLWFHVRGAGGSHTVLKLDRGQQPQKESIYQTASIAAYYSKMRKVKSVPVAYCERKYVRKPKRSSEGTVLLEREKVIFVQPGLP